MKKSKNRYNIYDLKLFNIDDFDILLHKILKQVREIICAEAGTIYTVDNDALCFNVFQNDSMTYEDIFLQYKKLKDVKLPLDLNSKYLAVDAYISEKIIIVNDVYKTKRYEFLGVKEYDKKNNYKTHSIITAPIIHPIDNKKLGVIQLINKIDSGDTFDFDEKDKDTLAMASSLIALSICQAHDDFIRLKELNDELSFTNKDLKRLYEELSEVDHVKEQYIGMFLNLYSEYIDKLDVYRKMVRKYIITNKTNDLLELTKSKNMTLQTHKL